MHSKGPSNAVMSRLLDPRGQSVFFIAAIVTSALACWLVWLHFTIGPPAQRITIRYAAGTSLSARLAFERQMTLIDPAEGEQGTWTYRLKDRSRGNISRLLAADIVEETNHIDSDARRIRLDQPHLAPPLRTLVETDWIPVISMFLGLAGTVLLWRVRRVLIDALRAGAIAVAAHAPLVTLVLVAVAAALVLALGASGKPSDSEFVFVYEAPSILAGDHPARDFYEWGAPLSAYLSAGMQLITGYRVIGEMLLQWSLIVAGVVSAFALGLRLSGSSVATLLVSPLVFGLLARTPTYHDSKLLCFPIAIWLCWRYLDQPTMRRSVWPGAWTGISFLFRHDYIFPVGFCSALALGLAPFAHATLSRRDVVRHLGVCGIAAVIVVIPWVVVVQSGEGLVAYAQARTAKFENAGNPYAALLRMNPFRELRPESLPAPAAAAVAFTWANDVTDSERRALEDEYGLRSLSERDADGRLRYQVANL